MLAISIHLNCHLIAILCSIDIACLHCCSDAGVHGEIHMVETILFQNLVGVQNVSAMVGRAVIDDNIVEATCLRFDVTHRLQDGAFFVICRNDYQAFLLLVSHSILPARVRALTAIWSNTFWRFISPPNARARRFPRFVSVERIFSTSLSFDAS